MMMQFDIWIPAYNLAIEYQGRQHYHANHFWEEFVVQWIRDEEKMMTSTNLFGITLIHIPYWWQMEDETLSSLISQVL
jgi:hypothetical protein